MANIVWFNEQQIERNCANTLIFKSFQTSEWMNEFCVNKILVWTRASKIWVKQKYQISWHFIENKNLFLLFIRNYFVKFKFLEMFKNENGNIKMSTLRLVTDTHGNEKLLRLLSIFVRNNCKCVCGSRTYFPKRFLSFVLFSL